MPVLVTGACGFVGLSLVEHLLARGEHVVGVDLASPPAQAVAAFAALPGRFASVQADVRDAGALREVFARHAPDRLVTLAAVTADAARERASPRPIFEVNVGGTLAALGIAAERGIGRIVHASSGAVYGSSGATARSLVEDETPLLPESLYGISKLAAEQAALRLAALHGLDLVVGRLGTCFGPWEADTGVRDTPSAPLQIVRLAERGEPVVLPRPSARDWLYARDAAAGLAALLEAPASARHRVVNVAAGFVGSLPDWCRALEAAYPRLRWRVDAVAANVDLYAPYDRAPMDIARLQGLAGFVARFDLAAAAADFVAWRRVHGTTSRERVRV